MEFTDIIIFPLRIVIRPDLYPLVEVSHTYRESSFFARVNMIHADVCSGMSISEVSVEAMIPLAVTDCKVYFVCLLAALIL